LPARCHGADGTRAQLLGFEIPVARDQVLQKGHQEILSRGSQRETCCADFATGGFDYLPILRRKKAAL
jgi:hypothetical protein